MVLDGSGVFTRVGIGLTNVATTPVKATAAEQHLVGKKKDAIAEAARLAGDAVSPSPDRRGSTEYKKEMTRVLTARALAKAYERAGGR